MEIIHSLFGSDPRIALFVVLNLIVIESLLSVDNAAVLATMVMDLPEHQRAKALKYGIIGAYFFRGVCLVFAAFLVKVLWLKALGGLYLFWLAVHYFHKKYFCNEECQEKNIDKNQNPIYKATIGAIGPFWSTVILVEIMDLAFSIDNVFAAVAFTNKIGLICLGVFIGILAMRFAAQVFVNLMEKFPFLEQIAFAVIGLLGFKLMASYGCDFVDPSSSAAHVSNTVAKNAFTHSFCTGLNSHNGDLVFSILTIAMFVVPILVAIVARKR